MDFAFNILLQIAVEKSLELRLYGADFVLTFKNKSRNGLGGFIFIGFCHFQKFFRTIRTQRKFLKQRGNLFVQFLLANTGFGTFHRFIFLGAVVINIVVDISIFLLFNPVFASYTHSATFAMKQTAKRLRFIFRFVVRPSSLLQNFLDFIKNFLCDDWLMFSFM